METKHPGRRPRILRQLERLGQRSGRFVQASLRRLELTDLEAHVLLHVGRVGRPVSELQQAFGIQPSTMTGVLDRLERRGFARREVNPEDRRSFRIVLTPEGNEAAEAVRAVVDGFEDAVRRQVSGSDVEAFFRVVEAVDRVTG